MFWFLLCDDLLPLQSHNYESVIYGILSQVMERLRIGTSGINDIYVGSGVREMVLFEEVLDGMTKRGI